LWDKLNKETNYTKLNNPMAWDRLNLVTKWIKQSKFIVKVLNIGFGPANLEKLILNQSNNYIWLGIDISNESVINANKLFRNASFKRQEINNIKGKNNYFNLILALEVLEHISPSKIFAELKKIHTLLNTNGILIISVPLNEDLESMLEKGVNPNAHVRIYTPKLIEAELKLSGFEIIRTKKLYAFNDNYFIKSIISNIFGFRKPNNIILEAVKSS
jgi:2-polyprenyl-3-methyl-5-hydroxy-6-metoxy-1,4-benzoquinol methylase